MPKGKIVDYKLTSAWSAVFKSQYREYEEQVNLLAFLFRSLDFDVSEGEIFMIYRDWSESRSKGNPDYPDKNWQRLTIPIWSFEEQKEFIENKVALLKGFEETPDDELPPCTSEEMWEKPTTYALMKEGRKSAIRVFDNVEEFWDYADKEKLTVTGLTLAQFGLKQGYSRETRPGERTKCENYCSAAPWCNQFKAYKEAKDG